MLRQYCTYCYIVYFSSDWAQYRNQICTMPILDCFFMDSHAQISIAAGVAVPTLEFDSYETGALAWWIHFILLPRFCIRQDSIFILYLLKRIFTTVCPRKSRS